MVKICPIEYAIAIPNAFENPGGIFKWLKKDRIAKFIEVIPIGKASTATVDKILNVLFMRLPPFIEIKQS